MSWVEAALELSASSAAVTQGASARIPVLPNPHKLLINFSRLIFHMLILMLQTQLMWDLVIWGIPVFPSENSKDFSTSVIHTEAILI